jgi:hypothetical protein
MILLVTGAPSAAVTWPWSLRSAVPESMSGRNVLAAVDSQGVVTAVWTTGGVSSSASVVAARREPGGGWTAARQVSDLPARAVGIDVGPDATVSVLMQTRTALLVSQRDQTGTWSRPELVVEGRRLHTPRIDASGGEPVVAWVSSETEPARVLAAVRREDGSWPRGEVVSRVDRESVGVELEVSAGGVATLAWLQSRDRGADGKRVWLRKRRVDGSRGPRRPLSSPGVIDPDLSIAEDGATAVSWVRFSGGRRQVQVAYRESGTRWTAALVSESEDRPYDVAVLARPGGEAFVGWTYPAGAFGSRVWSAHRTRQGWSPPSRVSPGHGGNSEPHFAVTGTGVSAEVWVLWSGNLDNPTSGNDYMVMSRLWRGDQWAITDVISSGHHTVGDVAVALGRRQAKEEWGCALFGVFDPAAGDYLIQASCLGAIG